MLIDHRHYTVRKGTLAQHLAIYAQYGFDVQRAYQGEPMAFLRDLDTEEGDAYVHLWVYEDATDRERKRAALREDPRWHAYLEQNKRTGFLIGQSSRLMTMADFQVTAASGSAEAGR